MNTSQKVVVISGGSKGLGLSIVKNLLAHNFIVATFSRGESPAVNELMQRFKENFYWEACDSSNFKDIKIFIKNVINKFGKVDCLINNVGMVVENIITMIPPQAVSKLIDTNLVGVIYLTQACIKNMLIRKNGNIINISSINSLKGQTGVSVYSATKAGVDGLTRSLSRELGPRGIRVNSVAPGYLKTDMTSNMSEKKLQQIIRRTPLGRLGVVDDVVGVINFLLSPSASFVTGQTIVVDGGYTC
jgi:3-oxoacyl-[acyl-carrier protein] reductase